MSKFVGDKDPTATVRDSEDGLTGAECARLTNFATERHLGTAEEASESLHKSVYAIRRAMKEYKEAQTELHDTLASLRDSRMSVVQEVAKIIPGLKDVRQFFLGNEYAEERRRLVEFVELCERLKSLRDSGFLDDIADTLLRLAVRP